MSIILDLPSNTQEDLIHRYIMGLKFHTQRELQKDLACKMVPSLDVTIALAKQYDSIMFNDKNTDKNSDKNTSRLNKSMTTMHISKQVNKPDDISMSKLGSA